MRKILVVICVSMALSSCQYLPKWMAFDDDLHIENKMEQKHQR